MAFNKGKYDKLYIKEHYYRPNLLLPKEYKEKIQKAADKQGVSKNAFVKQAIEDKLSESTDD